MAGNPPRSRVGMFSRAATVRDADGRTQEAKIINAEVLRDPDTSQPFQLPQAQRRFLRAANGRLRFPELLFVAPKKSGKTTFGAMLTLCMVLILGGRQAGAEAQGGG